MKADNYTCSLKKWDPIHSHLYSRWLHGSGYAETAVPESALENALVNGDPPKPAFALVVQQGVPSRPSPGRVIFPVSRLVSGRNLSVARGC
jgi:hypothetical protein